MGRHSTRSRGCQTCVKRRIKCDEETPACYQCIRTGRTCPGPLKGTMFLDMSDVVRQNMNTASTVTKRISVVKGKALLHATGERSPVKKSIPHKRDVVQASALPSSYQPSVGRMFQNLYIDNFMSLTTSVVKTLVVDLPQVVSGDARAEAYALDALCMTLYAQKIGNRDLEREAWLRYSQGLNVQRKQIHLLIERANPTDSMHGPIAASIFFTFFEDVATVRPIAWYPHCRAACKLVEIVGPKNCQSGPMHTCFRMVRKAAWLSSTIQVKGTVFSSKEWYTIPFEKTSRDEYDEICDALLQIPACFPHRAAMVDSRDSDPEYSEQCRLKLLKTAEQALQGLQEVEKHFRIDKDSDNSTFLNRLASITKEQVHFKSGIDARITLLRDSAHMMLQNLLLSAAIPGKTFDHQEQMRLYGESILAFAQWRKYQGLPTELMYQYSLKIIILCSPWQDQKRLAVTLLEPTGNHCPHLIHDGLGMSKRSFEHRSVCQHLRVGCETQAKMDGSQGS